MLSRINEGISRLTSPSQRTTNTRVENQLQVETSSNHPEPQASTSGASHQTAQRSFEPIARLRSVYYAVNPRAAWDAWAKMPTDADERRGEAIRRIKRFYKDSDVLSAGFASFFAQSRFRLQLDSLGLTSLPEVLPNMFWSLDVSHNRLSTLPPNLPRELESINANYNRIIDLPQDLPRGLESISLGGNHLTTPPASFWTALASLPSLRTIDLKNNQLTSLPEALPDMLESLNIDVNNLTTLPPNLPRGLVSINANNNHITDLPQDLPRGLDSIWLAGNHLTTPPASFWTALASLPSLRTIILAVNELTSLPETLPDMLESLDVSHNRLSTLPPNLPRGLKSINANNNHIADFPQDLPRGLESISLKGNHLTTPPASFWTALASLPSLRTIDLTNNQLTSLPEALPDMLESLNIDNNNLTTLPPNLPRGLRVIHANNNHITDLPQDLPRGLQSISLKGNHLTTPPASFWTALASLPSLRTIDLTNNELTNLPSDIGSMFNRQCTILLDGNPLTDRAREQLSAMANTAGYNGPRLHFSMNTWRASDAQRPSRPLEEAVLDWYLSTPSANIESEANQIKLAWQQHNQAPHAADFSQFLDRLHRVVSATKKESGFATQVQPWLTRLATDHALREHVFQVARDGLGSCEDRVALTFNTMKKEGIILDIERGEYDEQLNKLIPLARQMFRLDKLEQIAYAKAATLGMVDEVEVYLAYQVKLRDKLDLPLDITDMRFFDVSYVTQQDLEQAEKQVKTAEKNDFERYLASDFSPWKSVLKRFSPDDYAAAEDKKSICADQEFDKRLSDYLHSLGLDNNEKNRNEHTQTILKKIDDEIYGPLTAQCLNAKHITLANTEPTVIEAAINEIATDRTWSRAAGEIPPRLIVQMPNWPAQRMLVIEEHNGREITRFGKMADLYAQDVTAQNSVRICFSPAKEHYDAIAADTGALIPVSETGNCFFGAVLKALPLNEKHALLGKTSSSMALHKRFDNFLDDDSASAWALRQQFARFLRESPAARAQIPDILNTARVLENFDAEARAAAALRTLHIDPAPNMSAQRRPTRAELAAHHRHRSAAAQVHIAKPVPLDTGAIDEMAQPFQRASKFRTPITNSAAVQARIANSAAFQAHITQRKSDAKQALPATPWHQGPSTSGAIVGSGRNMDSLRSPLSSYALERNALRDRPSSSNITAGATASLTLREQHQPGIASSSETSRTTALSNRSTPKALTYK